MITLVLFVITIIGCLYAVDAIFTGDRGRLVLALIIVVGFGAAWQDRIFAPAPPLTPAELAQQEANKAAEDALKIPQKMSEAGGCLVYKFKDNGYWHYFTKCDKDVTTDATRSVRFGKSSQTKIESIVTQR